MRWLIPAVLGLGLLSACETAGGPPVGATDVPLEAGRERITFRGVSGASSPEVQDRALLHAANLALGQGYDWFQIVGRSVDLAPPTSPQISFGIGGASFGDHTAVGLGASRSVGGEPTYVASLEVLFGHGPKPPALDAYDARGVVASLGPRLQPPPH
jgi:hypothetical protein